MIKTLLKDKRLENVAVSIGIAIVAIKRTNNIEEINSLLYRLNEVTIIDIDLAKDVAKRILDHKALAFTHTESHGLILLEDIVTEDIDDACEDHRDIIEETIYKVERII